MTTLRCKPRARPASSSICVDRAERTLAEVPVPSVKHAIRKAVVGDWGKGGTVADLVVARRRSACSRSSSGGTLGDRGSAPSVVGDRRRAWRRGRPVRGRLRLRSAPSRGRSKCRRMGWLRIRLPSSVVGIRGVLAALREARTERAYGWISNRAFGLAHGRLSVIDAAVAGARRMVVGPCTGYGTGALNLTPDGAGALEAGVSMAMSAVATPGELVGSQATGVFALAGKTDALWAGAANALFDSPTGRLNPSEAGVSRARPRRTAGTTGPATACGYSGRAGEFRAGGRDPQRRESPMRGPASNGFVMGGATLGWWMSGDTRPSTVRQSRRARGPRACPPSCARRPQCMPTVVAALRAAVDQLDGEPGRDVAAAAWHTASVVRFFCSTCGGAVSGVRMKEDSFIAVNGHSSGDDVIDGTIAVGPDGTCACRVSTADGHWCVGGARRPVVRAGRQEPTAEVGVPGRDAEHAGGRS